MVTTFQADTIHTSQVMDCQIHAIGKIPFHRSGYINMVTLMWSQEGSSYLFQECSKNSPYCKLFMHFAFAN